jgi:lipoate-protein ligase A
MAALRAAHEGRGEQVLRPDGVALRGGFPHLGYDPMLARSAADSSQDDDVEVTVPQTSAQDRSRDGIRATELRWSVLSDGPLPGARNMARDHAMALARGADAAVLRLYRWENPTLSLGRNEPTDPETPRSILERGLEVVRRPTGGRAVVHWRELTYSVAMPARALGGPRSILEWINRRIAAALAGLGVAAEIATSSGRTPPVSAGPCFAAPVGGEVVVRGRKLVGSAQLRLGDTILQHGSILLENDQGMWDAEAERPATVSELLGRHPEAGELERAVASAFGLDAACVAEAPAASWKETELEEHYRSAAWTGRR